MPAKITATKDKETKNNVRYLIDSNKHKITGSLYVPKDSKKIVEVLEIEISKVTT